jgi:microcystin-dependent protein
MDGTIGEIRLFAGNYAPMNWATCNGAILQIMMYQALYSVLGVQFGGNGTTTFALPKLTPAVSAGSATGVQYVICLEGVYPQRP